MKAPRYARIVARLMARDQPAFGEPKAANREHAIQSIARALVAKKQRRARRSWGVALAAVAAATSLGFAGVRRLTRSADIGPPGVSALAKPSGSGTAILSSTGLQALLSPLRLQQGGQLVAGNTGGATVRLSTGTELTVEHDTSLTFESAGPVERFFLAQGALLARVAKLSGAQRFILRTNDAEIEVRGTAFRVAIVPLDETCGGSRTRLAVSEGLVEIRGAGASTYVRPGESWPVGCASPPPARAAVPSSTAPDSPANVKGHAPVRVFALDASMPHEGQLVRPSQIAANGFHHAGKIAFGAKAESTIALENELFSRAAAARRRGDSAAAARSFALLLARYPASPLAESAAVQRMNVLAGTDLTAARDAARQYLVRYPLGYAKADAQKLLAQP